MFRGTENGFAASAMLTDNQSKTLKVESASAIAAADWDRDGDVDLLCGYISGSMRWYPNQTKDGKLEFGAGRILEAGGNPIEAHDGGPCVADWDGDGDEDLIVGQGDGSVVLYRGRRKDGTEIPELSAAETLVKGGNESGGNSSRAKPAVADWNEDGKVDLLVGDFSTVSLPEPKITEEQRKKRDELRKKRDAVQKDMMVFFEQWDLAVRKKMGIPAGEDIPEDRMEEYGDVQTEVMMADKKYLNAVEESSAIAKELAPLEGGHGYVGFVRLDLRK